jgi:hypothetical protein
MTGDQLGGLVRTILAFLAGFVPATLMGSDTIAAIIGGLTTIIVAGWSWYTNRPVNLVAPVTVTGAPAEK